MKIKNTDILFVSLPPAFISIPSAPFSVLKSYLTANNIKSEVLYINHYIEKELDFFSEDLTSNTESLIPFLGILNKKNISKTEYINTFYNCLFPDLFLTERSYSQEILEGFEHKYLALIDLTISKIKDENCKAIGFSSKFSQWIPAILFAEKIKQAIPEIKIIVGGWTNIQAAYDFIYLNSTIDFCIWGEGEIPIKELMISILNDEDVFSYKNIPRLVYRENGTLIKSSNGNGSSYVDLKESEFIADFDDFFKSSKQLNLENVLLPVERGRGCNWNKCKFCYLAQGYKFRIKETKIMLKEIVYYMKMYNHFKFFFTDNDIIGDSIAEFNVFLDGLINIKTEYPKLEIVMAEIISKDVDINTIEKMNKAGFKNVQVGVEAISESLLKDINKKQDINDNFFFIKKAIKNGIKIKGANIIIDSPNETDQMLIESINNLHKYRFLLNDKDFIFKIIPLCISNYSRYLKQIKNTNKEELWNIGELDQLIPQEYYTNIDRFSLMHYSANTAEKPLWNLFGRALNFYKRKEFSYSVTVDNFARKIHYIEYSKQEIIKDIEITDEIHWDILNLLNNKVYNIEELASSIQKKNNEFEEENFYNKLKELKNEDIIYIDNLNKSVVSIIDLK